MTKSEEMELKRDNVKLKIHNKALQDQLDIMTENTAKISAKTLKFINLLAKTIGKDERELIEIWKAI